MTIAIDARYLTARLSGIGRVVLNLLRGLIRIDDDRPLALLVGPTTALPDDVVGSQRFAVIETGGDPRQPMDQLRLPRTLRRHRVRLLYCADAFGPLVTRTRVVITIHDLIPFTCRRLLRGSLKARLLGVWKAWLLAQTRAATCVATDSRHSAADLRRLLGVPGGRIRVVPLGGDFVASAAPPAAPSGPPTILYVGRRAPYKGVASLVRMTDRLRREVAPTLRLEIVGHRDPRYPEPELEAARLGLGDRVTFHGQVDDVQLAALYRRATVFAFPSLYEGYGLPPLEAMGFGTPVVASCRTSVPEVTGDAALLADPADEAAFAAAIARVLTDPLLAADLRRRGRARAAELSLERQALETLALFDEVLAWRVRR